MRDNGLDIYGTGLIAKESDIEKRPEFVRAYVEGTLKGLRYARENPQEALKILLKHKPELDVALTSLQLNDYYDVGCKASGQETYTNEFIKR